MVFGTDPAWGYPVLSPQSVTFSLKSSSIRTGRSTVGSGKGSPAAVGRVVTLQVERSGKWFSVATTHEKSGGTFSFTIKGKSAGYVPVPGGCLGSGWVPAVRLLERQVADGRPAEVGWLRSAGSAWRALCDDRERGRRQ